MSRKLRTLLKQNRRLEEKIFYEPRRTDWRKDLITPKEIADALTCLANRITENQSEELSVLSMLNDVNFITGRPLGSYEKNALQVVEILFNYLRINTQFDQKFYHILNSLQLAFTRLALDDLSFLDNPKHAAITFLEKLLDIGYHFDANAGKLTEFFVRAIELLINRLANNDQISVKTFSLAEKKFDEYLQSYNEKVDHNKNNLIKKVEKKSRKIEADFHTSSLIKAKTEGDEVPIFLLDFFENQLSLVLHQTIVKYGTQSKQCQQLLTDMDTITWSITCPYGDPDYNSRFESDVPSTMTRIFDSFKKCDLNNQYVQDFFFEVEDLHRKKLDGQRVHLDVMICADIFVDEDLDSDNVESWNSVPSKKFEIQSLQETHWYYLTIDHNKIRGQLLLNHQFSEKLYFVNLSGEELLTVEFNQTDYLSSNLEAFIGVDEAHFDYAINFLSNELSSKIEVLEFEYEKFKQQELIDKKQQEQLEKRTKQAMLDRQEEEKKIAEKRRLSLLEEKKKIHEKEMALELIEAEKRFKAKGILRKLSPGSKVAILVKPKRWVEASLMLMSKTTQRYIFIDKNEKKISEPSQQELIEMINQEKIKLISADVTQLDPMQSLVAKRREKLSQRL